jgi:TRAP-type C4-dicarboxylate transport system permease small subunit
MKKIGSVIEKIYFGVGAAAMGLLAVLVIFTVIMRYCFSLSWKSVPEFNVVLFAFTTFWGLGLHVLKNEPVSINILYDKFKPAVSVICLL